MQLAQESALLDPILFLRGLFGLPLHIVGCVTPAMFERLCVVNHIAWAAAGAAACRWAWMAVFELRAGTTAALDTAMRIAGNAAGSAIIGP